jgi:hypothetical protein
LHLPASSIDSDASLIPNRDVELDLVARAALVLGTAEYLAGEQEERGVGQSVVPIPPRFMFIGSSPVNV